MVVDAPMPGIKPNNVPIKVPMRRKTRFMGSAATAKPFKTWPRFSISSLSCHCWCSSMPPSFTLPPGAYICWQAVRSRTWRPRCRSIR